MRTGVVLAGGRGSRMGAYKPLLSLRGRPLVAYAIDALAPLCDEVLVMAGPHAAAVSRVAAGARVLADPQEGPHVALRLAARVAKHPTLVVAPADAPFLTPATYAPLLATGGNANFTRDGFPDPMVGVYERGSLLAFAGRSLRELPATRIPAGERARELRDLDTPEDMDPLQNLLIQEGDRIVLVKASAVGKGVVDDLGGWESLARPAFEDVWGSEDDDVWDTA